MSTREAFDALRVEIETSGPDGLCHLSREDAEEILAEIQRLQLLAGAHKTLIEDVQLVALRGHEVFVWNQAADHVVEPKTVGTPTRPAA